MKPQCNLFLGEYKSRRICKEVVHFSVKAADVIDTFSFPRFQASQSRPSFNSRFVEVSTAHHPQFHCLSFVRLSCSKRSLYIQEVIKLELLSPTALIELR